MKVTTEGTYTPSPMMGGDLTPRPGQMLLGAHVPAGWPPPLNDEASQQWTLKFLLMNPDAPGFGYWYIALPDRTAEGKSLVGIVGFKGKPAPDGTIEVGYSVMEDRQRRGF